MEFEYAQLLHSFGSKSPCLRATAYPQFWTMPSTVGFVVEYGYAKLEIEKPWPISALRSSQT